MAVTHSHSQQSIVSSVYLLYLEGSNYEKIIIVVFSFSLVKAQANLLLTEKDSDYSVKFGGYMKLNLIADLDGHRDKNQFLMAGTPVKGDAD